MFSLKMVDYFALFILLFILNVFSIFYGEIMEKRKYVVDDIYNLEQKEDAEKYWVLIIPFANAGVLLMFVYIIVEYCNYMTSKHAYFLIMAFVLSALYFFNESNDISIAKNDPDRLSANMREKIFIMVMGCLDGALWSLLCFAPRLITAIMLLEDGIV